jgi:hypothetical protein
LKGITLANNPIPQIITATQSKSRLDSYYVKEKVGKEFERRRRRQESRKIAWHRTSVEKKNKHIQP